MNLPVNPPVLPMLAKRVAHIPTGDLWLFEPKWDGSRAIIFRDHDEILLQSRDGKPLNRYFPELVDVLLKQLPPRCVLDGEIVIAAQGRLDFDALQLRIHPADSRIRLLAQQTPASIIFFDLLALDDQDLRTTPLESRSQRLATLLRDARPPIHLTPATRDPSVAEDWFRRFEGAGLDGVMAKALSGSYEAEKRTMLKVKHERDCDCVVAGFRWHKDAEGTAVGSLLLGLYDEGQSLQSVGACASFTMAKRRELVDLLTPYRLDNPLNQPSSHPWIEAEQQSHAQRVPGSPSRWNSGKDLSWVALRPQLVLEVAYEHMQGNRFRHMAQFRRWRTDKPAAACTFQQLEIIPPEELLSVFATGR